MFCLKQFLYKLKEIEHPKKKQTLRILKNQRGKETTKKERQKTEEQRLQKLESATTPKEVKNLEKAFELED